MSIPAEAHGRIAEIFASLQGEGVTAGVPSTFVRLQGCSVGCAFCDTKYSWDAAKGEDRDLQSILDEVAGLGPRNVVVTGGEPLESPLFVPLVSALKAHGYRVEVETAGVHEPPDLAVDQWNVSIKLAHSGVPESQRIRPRAIQALRARGAWFKFVVARPDDVEEIMDLERQYDLPREQVLLMPEGVRREEVLERSRWVWEACRTHGFRYSPRLHLLVWGARRGV